MSTTNTIFQQLAPYLMLGAQLAGTVVVFGLLGWWVDSSLGTTPWLMITGVVLGCVIGLIQFLRTVQKLTHRDQKQSSQNK